MTTTPATPIDEARRLTFLREETRFEIGLLHDRINALINAEAFLTIAYTIALTVDHRGEILPMLVAPALSLVGLLLSALAWPGVDASFKIIVEWDARHRRLMRENPSLADTMWRAEVRGRNTMIFARAVPAVFALAWAMLTAIALAVLVQG